MGKGGRDGGMRGEEIDRKRCKEKRRTDSKNWGRKWLDREIRERVAECVRPTEMGVELNIEPHSLLSDVWVWVKCVCVCPYLKTSGSGPIRSWEMVGISGLDQDLRWRREGGRVER